MKLKSSVASHPWRRVSGPATLAVLVAMAGTLAGCGQKGPLTLPSAAAAPATGASAPARP